MKVYRVLYGVLCFINGWQAMLCHQWSILEMFRDFLQRCSMNERPPLSRVSGVQTHEVLYLRFPPSLQSDKC